MVFDDNTGDSACSPPAPGTAELYRALYEGSPIAIELYDEDGRLAGANPACLELFGVAAAGELASLDLFVSENVGGDQKDRLSRGGSIRYGTRFDFDQVRRLNLVPTSRQGAAWFDVQITPLQTGHARYVVHIQEITAQRDAQEEMRSTRSRLEAMINALPDLLFLIDSSGHILDAHTSESGDYYVPPSVFLGKSLSEVLPSEAAAIALQAIAEAALHGIHRGAVYSLTMPQGVQWYELSIAVVGKPGQADPRYVVLSRNVTERHEAEETLRRRVAELDALRQMSELLMRRVDSSQATDSVCRLLRTLLAADDCYVDLLATVAAGSMPAHAPLNTEEGVHSLVVPLIAHEETLGSLVATRGATQQDFSHAETMLTHTAAELLAGVLGLDRLHAKEKEEAADEERRRIARDLHDAVAQHIHAAMMLAATMPETWDRDADEGRVQLQLIQGLLGAAFAELRILLYELRPEALSTTPLTTLFGRLRDALAGRRETTVEMSVANDLDLPQAVNLALYRVAQEALNNVGKHAQARHAVVIVAHDDGGVRLTVRDDGRGFDPGAAPAGMGQGIMRERAAAIGATLRVDSDPASGTTVTMVWRPGARQHPELQQ
jgi:PAS domain S-box-containing protein